MKKDYLQIISEQVSACYPEIPFGIEPIFINSSLVSAQSRQRYYWTNIHNITQPEERGIVLRDILEDQVGSEHYVGYQLQKNYAGGNQLNPKYKSQANTIHDVDKKSGTICAGTHGYANGYIGDKHKPVKDTERNRRHMKSLDEKSLCMTATMYKGAGNNGMTIVPQPILDDNLDKMTTKDGKAYALTTTYGAAGAKDSLEKKRRSMIPTSNIAIGAYRARSVDENGNRVDWKETKPKQMLEVRKDNKSNSLSSVQKDNVLTKDQVYWRKLTPLECERLQTVPDNYTNHVSNTQRYKMLGNGWTIEVIAHIFKNMEVENDS